MELLLRFTWRKIKQQLFTVFKLVKVTYTSGTCFVVSEPRIYTIFAQIMVNVTVQANHFCPNFQVIETNNALLTHHGFVCFKMLKFCNTPARKASFNCVLVYDMTPLPVQFMLANVSKKLSYLKTFIVLSTSTFILYFDKTLFLKILL